MAVPDETPYDDLDEYKDRVKRLKGSLTRYLLRSITFRLRPIFPTASRMHVVLYPDNVYRIWAVTHGRQWLAVCEDDVAPTWTSINLDADVDLLIRLGWSPRIHTYTREDGVEVHSVELEARNAKTSGKTRRRSGGGTQAGHVDEVQVPAAQNDGPPQKLGGPLG